MIDSIGSMSADSLSNKSSTIPILPVQNSEISSSASFQAFSEEHSACTGGTSDFSSCSERNTTSASNNIMNLNMSESEVSNLINFSMSFAEANDNLSTEKNCMNERVIEKNVTSDSETLKPSSGSTTVQNTIESKSIPSQPCSLNEYFTISSEDGVVRLSSSCSKSQNVKESGMESIWKTPEATETEGKF